MAERDPPRVVSRRRVFDGLFLRIDRDVVQAPDGREATVETLRHPGAVAVLPIGRDDTVTLVRQYRHPVGASILEVPAGKLDPGETPETCARRELEEEAGLLAGVLEPLGSILTTPGFSDERIWLFAARALAPGRQRLEPGEWLEIVRMPFDRAVAGIEQGEILDAKTVVCLLRAASARQSRS